MGLRSQYLFLYNTILTCGWCALVQLDLVVEVIPNAACTQPRLHPPRRSFILYLTVMTLLQGGSTSDVYAVSSVALPPIRKQESAGIERGDGLQAAKGPLKLAQSAAVLEVPR